MLYKDTSIFEKSTNTLFKSANTICENATKVDKITNTMQTYLLKI